MCFVTPHFLNRYRVRLRVAEILCHTKLVHSVKICVLCFGCFCVNIPGEQTDELADLLSHGSSPTSQIVLKELTDETLQYQYLPDGGVGRQCAQ